MTRLIHLLAFLTLYSQCWAQEPTSFYSTTDFKFAAVISSSELEEDPEIDYFRHICPGYGGYELVHEWGDARSWLNVKKGEVETNFYQQTMTHAGGSFPVVANGIIEWRGTIKGESFHPYAIIYRIEASGEEPNSVISKLFVIALNKGNAEFLGAVSGKDENDRARKIADDYQHSKG